MNKNYPNIFLTTTDTVPGLGTIFSEKNLKDLFEIKKRPKSKNIVIMVGSWEQARKLKDWSSKAEDLAIHCWPGATTLVLSESQAVRMPNCDKLRDLIKDIGPIYMTSANISGEPQLSYEEAKRKFSNIGNYYYFNKGSGKPSTIIRVLDKKVLRS